jgi:hypothetical protein
MTNDDKTRNDPESSFSFGVNELRRARAAQELRLEPAPVKTAAPKLGGDPYNTSGSFDRKNNWTRVGKR